MKPLFSVSIPSSTCAETSSAEEFGDLGGRFSLNQLDAFCNTSPMIESRFIIFFFRYFLKEEKVLSKLWNIWKLIITSSSTPVLYGAIIFFQLIDCSIQSKHLAKECEHLPVLSHPLDIASKLSHELLKLLLGFVKVCLYIFLALCQTKPSWSLAKISKFVEASALN